MRIAILFLCMTFSISLFSQDHLYRKDGTTLVVKDVQVIQNTISYKLYGDSVQYTNYISISVIDSIAFQNGAVTKFDPTLYPIDKRSMIGLNYPKPNSFSVDLYEFFVFKNICLNYEYMFVKQQISFSLSFTRSLYREEISYNENNYNAINLSDAHKCLEYGFKIAFSYYFLNIGHFNYGPRFLFCTNQYNLINSSYVSSNVEKNYINFFGLGFFAGYRLSSFMNIKVIVDLLYTNDKVFKEKALVSPQFSIGYNF